MSYSVDLRAFASEGYDDTLATLNFDVIICENEVLSPISASPISVTLDIGPSATQDIRPLINYFTTDDDYCPAINFYAKNDVQASVALASNPT